jgi:cytochrome c oxidase subunit 4
MSERVVPPTTYVTVFAILIGLTVLTVALSFLDLGEWHTVVGGLIGVVKAALVVLFFMHLYYSPKLTWIVAAAGLFWLGIFLVLTLSDYISRHFLAY